MKKLKLILCVSGAVVLGVFLSVLFSSSSFCIPIKVEFFSMNIPFIGLNIENKTYPFALDLGSRFLLSIRKDLLADLNKSQLDQVTWRDSKGEEYVSNSYIVPRVSMGTFLIKKVNVKEESDDFIINNIIASSASKKSNDKYGTIGRLLLEKTNLFLDFPHSVIYLTNHTDPARVLKGAVVNMIKIPFTMGRTGCIVEVRTDLGILRLSIDTGATGTVLRRTNVKQALVYHDSLGLTRFKTDLFEIGGHNFGRMDLTLFDICDELNEIDGVLGMDFLKCHAIFIDYKNKLFWIEKDKKYCTKYG